MQEFNPIELKGLYIPPSNSHKGQNGKVMVIAGSTLFHAAALWALEAASRIVDMVYFSSVTKNNELVKQAKSEFRNGIIIPRSKIEDYMKEADSVLIGPGLPRPEGQEPEDDDTRELTRQLLQKFSDKRWVIDGGSLQTIEPEWIPEGAIITPHTREFETLFKLRVKVDLVSQQAKKYNCTIVLKGESDIICSPDNCVTISGGNAGMTKGGTGDVLAGVAVGLYAKNDAWLSACAASFFNKRASERLFKTKGYWYNTSDLVDALPVVMKEFILSSDVSIDMV